MLPLVYHPNYSCPFPDDHRFVMSKFARLYQYLLKEDIVKADGANLFQPQTAEIDSLAQAHDAAYLSGLANNDIPEREWRRVGLPWTEALIERTFTASNGTLLAAEKAFEFGIACHLAGGTHHAHYDFGSGFCMVNDLAYAALSLLRSKQAERVLIFDCDVHQGDGTAKILESEPTAFTCSIHCEKNFPFRKSESDLDVGLELYMEDEEYLGIVKDTLSHCLRSFKPDIVLYDAGVDVWQDDELGKLDISWRGIYDRDYSVLKTCLAQGIPIATVIGGGYDRNHQRLAERHAIVVEAASNLVSGT